MRRPWWSAAATERRERREPDSRPADGAGPGRHGWPHLQAAGLSTGAAAHREGQSAPALSAGDQFSERQHGPSIASRAIGRQLVLVAMQASDRAEIDHAGTVAGRQAHTMSPAPEDRGRRRSGRARNGSAGRSADHAERIHDGHPRQCPQRRPEEWPMRRPDGQHCAIAVAACHGSQQFVLDGRVAGCQGTWQQSSPGGAHGGFHASNQHKVARIDRHTGRRPEVDASDCDLAAVAAAITLARHLPASAETPPCRTPRKTPRSERCPR